MIRQHYSFSITHTLHVKLVAALVLPLLTQLGIRLGEEPALLIAGLFGPIGADDVVNRPTQTTKYEYQSSMTDVQEAGATSFAPAG